MLKVCTVHPTLSLSPSSSLQVPSVVHHRSHELVEVDDAVVVRVERVDGLLDVGLREPVRVAVVREVPVAQNLCEVVLVDRSGVGAVELLEDLPDLCLLKLCPNLFSNFWLVLPNFERPILGCIEADFCRSIVNTK